MGVELVYFKLDLNAQCLQNCRFKNCRPIARSFSADSRVRKRSRSEESSVESAYSVQREERTRNARSDVVVDLVLWAVEMLWPVHCLTKKEGERDNYEGELWSGRFVCSPSTPKASVSNVRERNGELSARRGETNMCANNVFNIYD